MAGRGPAPKDERVNKSDVPTRGEWKAAAGEGWQHGPIPRPPDGLLKASRDAWDTWMRSWVAAHWGPLDLPGLRKVIQLYDGSERGMKVGSELRLMLDTYGVTPKGQQDRRWKPPETGTDADVADGPSPYAHLRVVG